MDAVEDQDGSTWVGISIKSGAQNDVEVFKSAHAEMF